MIDREERNRGIGAGMEVRNAIQPSRPCKPSLSVGHVSLWHKSTGSYLFSCVPCVSWFTLVKSAFLSRRQRRVTMWLP